MKNTSILIKLVKKEAKALRKYAKKSELSRLNFDTLLPEDIEYCIYGQMTGYCFSKRAAKLIQKCADKVYIQKDSRNLYECKLTKKLKFDTKIGTRIGDYFSPIECFITNPNNEENGNNLALINYLKGITSKLVFS